MKRDLNKLAQENNAFYDPRAKAPHGSARKHGQGAVGRNRLGKAGDAGTGKTPRQGAIAPFSSSR